MWYKQTVGYLTEGNIIMPVLYIKATLQNDFIFMYVGITMQSAHVRAIRGIY